MLYQPFYDPAKTYDENFRHGPFGVFSDGKVVSDVGEPQYDFLGIKLYSLFGIPAGPLINGRFTQAALDKGFDIVTYKTVRTKQYPCHPWPNVVAVAADGDVTPEKAERGLVAQAAYGEPLSITNSFGVPSYDPDFWQADLAAAVRHAKHGQVVIGSVQATLRGDAAAYVRDFAKGAKLVKDAGVKIVEANLSCPNEGTGRLLCFDIKQTKAVVEAVKDVIGNTPLIIKIAYFHDQNQLENFISEIGAVVDGIEAINTIGAKIVDERGRQYLPGEGRLRSGVCGAGIKWAGLAMVTKLAALRDSLGVRYTIIGVGGVMNAGDYQDYREAGADAVLSATGAMWNPYLAREIKKAEARR